MTEYEFMRESRKILRKLIAGSHLKPLADGSFAVVRRAKDTANARTRAPSELVKALQARGLVQAHEDGFAISDAGKGWFLRQSAADNPFAAQHRTMAEVTVKDDDGQRIRVAVNMAESPLAMMRYRKNIDAVQFEAGERLRRDYVMAQMMPRMTIDWSAPCISGTRAAKPDDMPEKVLAAKHRFAAAMNAVGPELDNLLFDLCCDLRGVKEVEDVRGWPRASAKVVIRIALERLARHYGLVSAAPAKSKCASRAS